MMRILRTPLTGGRRDAASEVHVWQTTPRAHPSLAQKRIVCNIAYMSERMTGCFRTALRYATPSIEEIAREAGYSRIMFDIYLNRRPPSRQAALALAQALEARAANLVRDAHVLREAAGEEGGVSP